MYDHTLPLEMEWEKVVFSETEKTKSQCTIWATVLHVLPSAREYHCKNSSCDSPSGMTANVAGSDSRRHWHFSSETSVRTCYISDPNLLIYTCTVDFI